MSVGFFHVVFWFICDFHRELHFFNKSFCFLLLFLYYSYLVYFPFPCCYFATLFTIVQLTFPHYHYIILINKPCINVATMCCIPDIRADDKGELPLESFKLKSTGKFFDSSEPVINVYHNLRRKSHQKRSHITCSELHSHPCSMMACTAPSCLSAIATCSGVFLYTSLLPVWRVCRLGLAPLFNSSLTSLFRPFEQAKWRALSPYKMSDVSSYDKFNRWYNVFSI